MQISFRNVSIIILMFVLILILLFNKNYFKDNTSLSTSHHTMLDQVKSSLPFSADSQTPSRQIKTSPVVQRSQEEIFLMGNAADREKVHKWYVEQGYYEFDDKNQSYLTYDQATLESLAAKGDLRAIDALAKLYMTEEFVRNNGLAPSKQQFWNAAIWGSTVAFVRLAIGYESGLLWAKTEDEKRSISLEVLALYGAGELRGEKWLNRDSAELFKKLQNITLSDTEEKFVTTRAYEILNQLQQERHKLGLNDFDNSVPPEVEKFYKTLDETDKRNAKLKK